MDATYAIVTEKVLAMCVITTDEHQIELTKGMMVEVTNHQDRYSTIVIHDFYQQNYVYENNVYLAKTSALLQVPIDIWPFLMAINDPLERANVARDKSFVEYILKLTENSFVTVNGQYFNNLSAINQSLSFLPEREPRDKSLDYQCVVKYIGPVDELSIPGYIFGLELLVN